MVMVTRQEGREMRVRTKVGDNRQDRIMEIVGHLLRRILESPDEASSESELVRDLHAQGYRQAEIDAAIELVFAVPEIIAGTLKPPERSETTKTRIFSPAENFKLGMVTKGHLLRYREYGLLSEAEWEEVLIQLLLSESREVGLSDLHHAVRKVVTDEQRLLMLLPKTKQPVYGTIN